MRLQINGVWCPQGRRPAAKTISSALEITLLSPRLNLPSIKAPLPTETSITHVSREQAPARQWGKAQVPPCTGPQDGLKPSVALQFWGPVTQIEGVDTRTRHLSPGPTGCRVAAEAFPTSRIYMGYPCSQGCHDFALPYPRQVDRAHPRPCPSLHGREPQADPAI